MTAKGVPWSEARRAKGGKPHSAEARAKMSADRRGVPWSGARRAAGGTPCTDEQRAKISAAKRGRSMSAAARAKMSQAQRAAAARRREAVADLGLEQAATGNALALIEYHAALRRSGKGF